MMQKRSDSGQVKGLILVWERLPLGTLSVSSIFLGVSFRVDGLSSGMIVLVT